MKLPHLLVYICLANCLLPLISAADTDDDPIDSGYGDIPPPPAVTLPPDDDLGLIVTFNQAQKAGATEELLTQVHEVLEKQGTANATTTNLTIVSTIETGSEGQAASGGGPDESGVRSVVISLGGVGESSAVDALQQHALVQYVIKNRWVVLADATLRDPASDVASPGPSADAAAATAATAGADPAVGTAGDVAAAGAAGAASPAAFAAAAEAAGAGAAAAVPPACVSPYDLTTGLSGTLKPGQWNSQCMNDKTRLVWVGQRCGSTLTQVQYTAIVAINKATNLTAMNGRQPCFLKFNLNQQPNSQWHLQRFGTCGRAPLFNRGLPTCVSKGSCVRTPFGAPIPPNGALNVTANMTVQRAKCGGRTVSTLKYEGVSCGPNNTHVLWQSAVASDGCRLTNKLLGRLLQAQPPVDAATFDIRFLQGVTPADLQMTQDVFGLGCGSPPRLAVSKAEALSSLCRGPEPLPPGKQLLPRRRLSGARVPVGINRIGAFLVGQGSPDLAKVNEDDKVTVAVLDTGIGDHPDLTRHPDGGVSFISGTDDNETNAMWDGHGHGTHVAGIVGAKGGLVGVSPGVRLYSLKIMRSDGFGDLARMVNALRWLEYNAKDKGIRVAIMSIAAIYPKDYFNYENEKKYICSIVSSISMTGVVVVVAAGNNLGNYAGRVLPADCPSAVVVTAESPCSACGPTGTSAPASYSNWIDDTAQPEDKANVFAAPGTANSTVPENVDSSMYKVLSGTSMAAPHVAGVFSNCFMAGACQTTDFARTSIATVKAASISRLTLEGYWQPFGFLGDATNTTNNRYRGYMVWNAY